MVSFQNDILPLKNELFRLALRITLNAADAEDVVQDTMLKVWKRRNDWQQIESIEAFCLTICRNLALDRLRHKDYQSQTLDMAADPADASHTANPEQMTVQRDRVRLVRQLINRLPERQRSCMQLRDIEGKSYRDIAAVLGLTEQQVKVTIFRARQAVKTAFQEQEDFGIT